jgi:DNA repair exonuclease SbcCD ATPase subunit
MRTVISHVITLLAGAAAFGGLTVAMAAQGNRVQQTDDVLPQLLTEVRGLRAAIEQLASAGPHVQLVLGRVQLQEQRIGNQVRRLDTLRANLVAAQKELESLEQQARQLQETIRDYPNSEGRRLAEYELTQVKPRLARAQAEVQRMAAEETLLTQDIAAEQSRWTDFNQRLEELERGLSRR